ncbi:15992_t:CDS:2 [Entrophospora sp. SA101]|nr:15992_t:CDS:2 [Entrophospora sp. SA101]
MSAQNAASKESTTITQLFAEVERSVKKEDYVKVLKTVNKILQLSPDDKDALQCKIVALIRLGKYQNTLDLLTKDFPDEQFLSQKIFCHYRLNQFKEISEQLQNYNKPSGNADLLLRHLEAQVAYKIEDYTTSLELYYNLLKETDKKEDTYNDILTNFNAVKAALLFSGGSLLEKYAVVDSSTTYELAYNSACIYIGLKNLGKAEKLLKLSQKLCRQYFQEEELSQQEIEKELATINVQLAYVYQLQGRVSDAIELYQYVLKFRQKDTELFDSAKKLRVANAKPLETKLFRIQKRTIAMNESLLALYMHKYAACQDSVRKLLQIYPENDYLYLILVATSYLQKKTSKAIQELQECVKTRPTSLPINFALIQLQLLQSNTAGALESFSNFLASINDNTEKNKPGYVGLLVWLYENAGSPQKAIQALEEAGEFWKSSVGSSEESASILKQTASFKLKIGKYREAAQDFEQLVKADPTDTQSIAGLVAAYSQYDVALAEKYESSLPDVITSSTMDIDVESLEKVVPGVKKSYVKKIDGNILSSSTTNNKPKKKRKRKPLLPKSYDPSIKPDPERWLPKHERSTYRVKGKKKLQMMKGSQGVSVGIGVVYKLIRKRGEKRRAKRTAEKELKT